MARPVSPLSTVCGRASGSDSVSHSRQPGCLGDALSGPGTLAQGAGWALGSRDPETLCLAGTHTPSSRGRKVQSCSKDRGRLHGAGLKGRTKQALPRNPSVLPGEGVFLVGIIKMKGIRIWK